jgi:predicted enzyme related to lactoylglutathione lyase
MKIESLAGIVLYSTDVKRSVAFYRELGIPFAPHQHGNLPEHQETFLGGVHFALWHGNERAVPVFRVSDLAEQSAAVVRGGAQALHRPLDLGEGKQLTSFRAPDGLEFRLIELRPDARPPGE